MKGEGGKELLSHHQICPKLFDIHLDYKFLFSLVILCLKYIPASASLITSQVDTTDLSLLKDWECSGSIQVTINVLRVRA